MKAEELRLEELVRFGDGLVDLHGRRLLILDIASFAQFCRDLIEMVGQEDARRIMTRWGYFWGSIGAATMQRLFQWDNLSEWIKAAFREQVCHPPWTARSSVRRHELRLSPGLAPIRPRLPRSGCGARSAICERRLAISDAIIPLRPLRDWPLPQVAASCARPCRPFRGRRERPFQAPPNQSRR